MCRRRVKICKKVTCRIRSSRYRLYVPMVGLFRKPGRGRNACAVIIPKELTILRVGNTRSLISIGARRKSHTSSQLRGEDSNPGMHKKACVSHENLVRDRVYRESMGSIMGTYLVQYPICVGAVLLDHRQFPRFSGRVDSMEGWVERDRIKASTHFFRRDDSMRLHVTH